MLGGAAGKAEPAQLHDHAVFWVQDQPFPMIVAQMGAVAEGVLLRDLTDEDVARLDFYEGGFVYDLRDVTVRTADGPAPAQVYFPQEGRWPQGAPWSLEDWADQWGSLTLDAAAEVMMHFRKMDITEAASLLPFFRARAWSRQLAAQPAPQTLRSTMTAADVEILRDRGGFDGFFRLRAFELHHRRYAGGWTNPVPRESFVSYDAALVLPYDPKSDRVLLIEQLRFGPLMRGDPAPWVLEPVAGLIDAGEDPETTARREAIEEAGLELGRLELINRIYASPGYSTEFFHCYAGICDLDGRETQLGGLDSENEDIRSHVVPLEDALALIDTGEINAGPLTMMLLWLARHRERLRAAG